MEETKKYTKNNVIISGLIGILIGLGGYYLYDNVDALKNIKNRDNKEDNSGKSYTNNLTENADASGDFSKKIIVVKDQPAGFKVIVDSVSLENVGWVAIHEDRDGELGNILGAYRFENGTHSGEVELLRNTVEGGTYYAVIYNDDGDREFDHKKDVPLVDGLGNEIISEFKVIRIR